MVGNRQPPADESPKLNVTVSLSDIYDQLCPKCRDAFLDLMARQVGAEKVRHALQAQLESGSPPPPSALTPHVDR